MERLGIVVWWQIEASWQYELCEIQVDTATSLIVQPSLFLTQIRLPKSEH